VSTGTPPSLLARRAPLALPVRQREALDSLAIDFSRVLDPTTVERVMREFLAGDRGAFVKRLTRIDYGAFGPVIRDKFESDGDFRRYVQEYFAQFEQLLADARAADTEGIIAATFVGSDIGKLYMLLTGVLGRR